MPGIIVDIGTGDGRFPYELAKDNLDRLVIGVDPNQKGLERMSSRSGRKEHKGGLSNVFFVLSDVRNLPEELNDSANQIFINFPWGSLLSGIVNVDEEVWHSIKRICQPGAVVDLVLGYDEYMEQKEIEKNKLPPKFNLMYVEKTMKPKLHEMGFGHMQVNSLDEDHLRNFPSSWAKKLSFGRDRKFFHVRLKVFDK